jgi:glycosyltransferase involved in cell wall biosynthesis
MVEADALARKALKKRLYWELIEKHSFQNASAIHAITENEAAQIARLVSSKHTFVIPNGIETVPHNPKVAFPKEPTILFIGRLHPIKALDRLMMAIAVLDVRLIVAGDGEAEHKKYIYDLVDKLNIGEKIEFLGFVGMEQKKALYEKASFICVPSHSEVLSLVALEAISYGLPVLISKACHFDDIRTHGAGIVIEDNEPSSIAMGIERMLSIDLLALSQNAFELSKKYSLSSMVSKMVAEYGKISGMPNKL